VGDTKAEEEKTEVPMPESRSEDMSEADVTSVWEMSKFGAESAMWRSGWQVCVDDELDEADGNRRWKHV
jgi:hypothetical protein